MDDGTRTVSVERTKGSVFSALGYPDSEEMERKSRLVSVLNDTIEARGLTQSRAAQIIGVDQPTLSKILSGRTRSYSTDKLADMLNALGRNIRVVVEDLPPGEPGLNWPRGHTTVEVGGGSRGEELSLF